MSGTSDQNSYRKTGPASLDDSCPPPRRVKFPFSAVVGHDAAKRALLLLAVDPNLRGVLIASSSDSAAATLARAFGSLLPTEDADRSHPDSGEVEDEVVEVPINVSEDCLLGGLDLERTIQTGKRQISKGILARANSRVLFATSVNLFDASAKAHIAQALDSRFVRIEREGLSAIHDADFVFVGTFEPDSEPEFLLRPRVALVVDSTPDVSVDEKANNIKRFLGFDRSPYSLVSEFSGETSDLRRKIKRARSLLPRVRVSREHANRILEIATQLGVEGNLADIFALRAARANAALAERTEVNEVDLISAIQLVLTPRATRLPDEHADIESNERSQRETESKSNEPECEGPHRDVSRGEIEDVLVKSVDARLPDDFLQPKPNTGRKVRAGKRFKGSTSTRGRYVRSTTERPRDARIAIDATLRAAAPFQLTRRARNNLDKSDGLGLGGVLKVDPGDLRFKEFRERSGILFMFAVDASGSMAVNRMAQAKGALTRLLQQAYRHRDKVALISFRGEVSRALLAPTRSVELAKKLVDAMPVGGGTPLAAGIAKAIEMARTVRLQGMPQALLVLFTDGRANVSLTRQDNTRTPRTMADELRQLGILLDSEGIKSIVVDTKSRFISSGEGEALARMIGARYFYLPRSDATTVFNVVNSVTGRPQ